MRIAALAQLFLQKAWPLIKLRDALTMHPLRELSRRALMTSVDYLEANMGSAVGFGSRRDYLRYVTAKVRDIDGLVCEFGVYRGDSLRQMAKQLGPGRRLHGFDSFAGLPESWIGTDITAGAYDAGGSLPRIPENVTLHPGWFDVTIPPWKEEHLDKIVLLHIDCDLYSSTKTVLDLLHDRFQPGTIIMFDEYFNYPGWQEHEYKAFQEYVDKHDVSYTYVAYAVHQVAVRLDSIG